MRLRGDSPDQTCGQQISPCCRFRLDLSNLKPPIVRRALGAATSKTSKHEENLKFDKQRGFAILVAQPLTHADCGWPMPDERRKRDGVFTISGGDTSLRLALLLRGFASGAMFEGQRCCRWDSETKWPTETVDVTRGFGQNVQTTLRRKRRYAWAKWVRAGGGLAHFEGERQTSEGMAKPRGADEAGLGVGFQSRGFAGNPMDVTMGVGENWDSKHPF